MTLYWFSGEIADKTKIKLDRSGEGKLGILSFTRSQTSTYMF